jgi:hypothetical protein
MTRHHDDDEHPPRYLSEDEMNAPHSLREVLALAAKLGARMERRTIDGREVLQLRFFIDEASADDR